MEFYRWKPEEYREKTYHLNPYQDGCYRRLIDHYMETRKPLPDNDQSLARICGISLDDWMLHAASIVRAFFKHHGGKLFNQHCDEELDYQDNRRKFASDKAQKAAITRHSKNKQLDATSKHDECLAVPEYRVKSLDISSKEDIIPPIVPQTGDSIDAKPKRKSTRKPSTFIDDKFQPDFESLGECSRLGIDPDPREFIDYWKGVGKPMCDWQATFRNNVRRLAGYRKEREQRASNGRQGSRDVVGAALRAAEVLRQRES